MGKKPLHIGTSPLTNRIYAGHVLKDGQTWSEDKEDVTGADTKAAREVFIAEAKDKPAAMREKIVEGKLATYFADMVLMDQQFIKNPEITIQGLVDAAVQKFGEKTAVGRFCRFKILER